MGENLLWHQPVKNIAVGGGDRLLSTVQQKVPMLFSCLPIPSHLFTVHETTMFLLVTLPNIHRFKKNSLMDLAINLS